jgi:hypothetical protein
MSAKNTKDRPTPASDAFKDAVSSGGSCTVAECDFCGRVHFTSAEGGGDYGEGELAELQAQAAREPDKYIEEGLYNTIATGDMAGHHVVIECPCNGLSRYEDFIWSHRELIMDYLTKRAKEEYDEAKELWDMIQGAKRTRDNATSMCNSVDAKLGAAESILAKAREAV